MYRLVRVFAYVKLFTQRLQSRIKRRSSNNHSQSLPAIDHSNTYRKPKPKAFSNKKPHGNLQLKSSDNNQDHQHLQHTMKPRDQSLNKFTEKLFVTNQQENPGEDSGFSSNNQDAPHLQNICYRNDSQQPQPLLQSSHKDQSLQPNIHHSQEADDLCPQPLLLVEHTESKKEQSTQCLNGLQQTTTEIQPTPTDLVPQSSNLLSTPDDHHELYSFLISNEQHSLFNEQRLKEGQQKLYESTENNLQKESVCQLQTDLSPSLSSPPTSLISTVKKKKQHITAKRQIGDCHQLSPSNLRSARIALYSIMQQLFLPEFRYIKGSTTPEDSTLNLPIESSSRRIKKNSHLLSLSPFFDEDNNVIRVGDRLTNSPYSVDKKFPIIIPKTSPLAELLIRESHLRNLHSGPQMTLFALRQTVWIPGGIASVKKVIHNCKPCIRFDARIRQPLMGDLPAERMVESFAFQFIGMDYCGLFYIKDSSQKLQRSYAAIFICFTTKAIHLEPVENLTKEDCLNTLKRFTGRRGTPQAIDSDHSTTFIGARGELEFRRLLRDEEFKDLINNLASQNHIDCFTIPPRTPHFGGLWEAAVKSLKRHLYRTVGSTKLSTSAFTTLLTQIEAILNSRPLTAPSTDINIPLVLTPGHFIIGRPVTAIPEPSSPKNYTLSRHWRNIDKMIRQFWKKWSVEDLSSLQQRNKWRTENVQPAVNDIVIIKEDNTPPMCWPLARIIQTFDGNDNIVRVFQVKTNWSLHQTTQSPHTPSSRRTKKSWSRVKD